MNYLVVLLYLVSFGMFIYGLMGLTGPKTAVRGNWIAAAGMGLAVIATLIAIRHTENWGLIIAGLLVGVALGVPPARLTKMTAMPQLVAFYNGVGGGTVALIALSAFQPSSTASRRPCISWWPRCSPRSSARSRSGARSSRSASCRKSCPAGPSESASCSSR
jgi:NAD/NADP transhydrogenase beta subunit